MAKALTVEDVILGEAKAGSFEDMLGIASVVFNRAVGTNTTMDAIVSAPNQFDAYGRRLPAGVQSYRDLAREAIQQVQEFGPVHDATFYATPKAKGNLPGGLTEVTRTDGHVYFSDPKGRSIRTANGYRKPDLDAITNAAQSQVAAVDRVPVPEFRDDVPIEAPPMGRAYPGGIASISPSFMDSIETMGSKGTIADFDTSGLTDSAFGMVSELADRGFGDLGVNSGYRSPSQNRRAGGASRSMHMAGNAVDLATRDLPVADKSRVLDAALSSGAKGIGIYPSGSMHIDTRSQPSFWGPDGFTNPGRTMDEKIVRMPEWAQADLSALAAADGYEYLPSGANFDVPAPSPRPDAPMPESLMASASMPSQPQQAYSRQPEATTPFDSMVGAPDMLPSPASAYTDPYVSAPTPKQTIADVTKEMAAPVAVEAPDPMSLQEQYISYGMGKTALTPEQNLELDVMSANPSQLYDVAPKTAMSAPTIADAAPSPHRSAQPRAQTARTQESASVDAINRANADKDSSKLKSLQTQDSIVNGIVKVIGGLVGSAVLGPAGGMLGATFLPQMLQPITNQAPKFFPTAPVNPNRESKGYGYSDLGSDGRDAYESSGQFRDAVDKKSPGLY